MTDVVELLQQLCNIEFGDYADSPTSISQRKPSTVIGLEWLQPPKPNRTLVPNSHERNLSISSSHLNGSVTGGFNGNGAHIKVPTPLKTVPSEQHQLTMTMNMNVNVNANSMNANNPDTADWRILIGRHLIVGDDRKFMLMHLLRRRLRALSNVLEDLIRAMQDLRMALRRERSLMTFDDDTSKLTAEIDTRASLKAASKLYDIIDHLENIQI